jgi:hypothetical protein
MLRELHLEILLLDFFLQWLDTFLGGARYALAASSIASVSSDAVGFVYFKTFFVISQADIVSPISA